jgi:protease-4
MRRLKAEHKDIPLYVVVKDMAASGGYFVATAADRIYVNKSSLVGSIGVRMDSFGLVDLIKKIGVERRLLTAGEHKGSLDPFLPEDAGEKEHFQKMLDQIHQHFIQAVKDGRGDRLQDSPDLFSGRMWTGEEGISLGLVDDYGTSEQVARDVIKHEELKDFTHRELLLDRLAGRVGASMAQVLRLQLLQNIEFK